MNQQNVEKEKGETLIIHYMPKITNIIPEAKTL